ncbi:MAG: acetate kinase [Bacteroidota bacterium]|nr:acetate kinase [Bacteroidota bacterium]MDP4206227.1 acetate kinase [Bacteroidota bacterium]
MDILVLNCGSSSIKYQLLSLNDTSNLLAKGIVDRIGNENSELEHKVPGREPVVIRQIIPDHTDGIRLILQALISEPTKVIDSLNEIEAVGHRVAHGGEFFSDSVLINDEVKLCIKNCIALAPLHNPANLAGIESVEKLMPEIPQIAVFDTAFHQTMPKEAYLYAIPYSLYKKYAVRRYGFHGTSHKYVAQKACQLLGLNFKASNIITCHLGNGASITAIHNGKSVDTSMGFTPNEGLIMGTRSGSIDPGIIPYIASMEHMGFDDVNEILNKRSGVKGISQLSSDMRDLVQASATGHEGAELALQMYALRVKKYIGAYMAILNGVDLIIFTGGIGENNFTVRRLCLEGLDAMGILFDEKKNDKLCGKDEVITLPESKVKVMTITTDEELVIAQETLNIVKSSKINS